MISTVPAVTPVTMPAAATVAFGLLAVHVPPPAAPARAVLLPAHTVIIPVIGPAASRLTVTVTVLAQPVSSV